MTQDEIIEMARQAQQENFCGDKGHWFKMEAKDLERFAKLVAAKQDPKIAIADAYRAGVDSGIAAEREACAKVCDDNYVEYEGKDVLATWCSKVIRARGEIK